MVARGTTETGKREILGFGVYRGETKETWRDFLEKLKKRGLHGGKMITSDAHEANKLTQLLYAGKYRLQFISLNP